MRSSASNRIIHAKDHASVQLNLAEVDPNTGIMTGTSKAYAICGAIRGMGESDDCIARLAKRDGVLTKYVDFILFFFFISFAHPSILFLFCFTLFPFPMIEATKTNIFF